jgi:hypothetical protein
MAQAREVSYGVGAAVLLRDDVLDLERREDVGLREMAVLTPASGPFPGGRWDSFGKPL